MNNLYKLLIQNSQSIKETIINNAATDENKQYISQVEDNLGFTIENITNLFISFSSEEYVQQERLHILFSSFFNHTDFHNSCSLELDVLLSSIKSYRNGYLEFLNTFSFERSIGELYKNILSVFFDKFEIYITKFWLKTQKASTSSSNLENYIRYQIVVENSLNPIIIINHDKTIFDMNITARKLYYEINEEYFFQGKVDESIPWLTSHFDTFMKSKARSNSFEQVFKTKKGTKYYDIKLIKTHNSDVRRNEIAVIMNNITGYKKMTKTINENKLRYHSLFDNMFEACSYNRLVFDDQNNPVDFVITDVNEALIRSQDLSYDDIIGKSGLSVFNFLNQQDFDWLNNFAKVVQHGDNIRIKELYLASVNKWYSISIYSSEENYFAFVYSDITEKKQAEESVVKLAYYDILTGLPNSKQLDDKIKEAISDSIIYNKKFAVMFIDITNFKKINNTLGHKTGDAMLTQIAGRLKHIIRNDDIVAKLGGDKFVILYTNTRSEDDVVNVANKIVETLKAPFTFNEHEFFIEINIGISMFPNDADNMHTLKRNADTAMFIAKNSPDKRYLFHTKDMNDRALRNLIMEADLRKALQKNQLSLHYQPLVNISNGNIIAFEALLRWEHPVNGMISPNDFIPIAEENGLIVPIGEWVLRAAAMKCKEWQINGYDDIFISVNVSIHQLQQENFVDNVRQIISDIELDPKYLKLEITESVYMQHIDAIIETLTELKSMGLTLSLDDFGTGYSSLNYLNRLPINTLKIDKSFIRNMDSNKDYAILTKAIIKMAHSLNLDVVAEGVETEEELTLLKEHNCDKIQGFLFSKPIPPDAVDDILLIKRNLYQNSLK